MKKSDYKNSRSWNMSRIKSKDTKPEIKLRKALYAAGYRYRKNYRKLPGTPDIAITRYQIAIFVDGEFWHGYDWKNRKEHIHSNRDYWIHKIENNIKRDIKNDALLRQMGWIPVHFWENEVISSTCDYIKIIDDFILFQQNGQLND